MAYRKEVVRPLVSGNRGWYAWLGSSILQRLVVLHVEDLAPDGGAAAVGGRQRAVFGTSLLTALHVTMYREQAGLAPCL